MLRSAGMQVPLALLSFAFALGLVLAVVFAGDRVGGSLALVVAALFLINGLARLWLRRATARPKPE